MSYLLDTHALVWALTAPDHLSTDVREVIASRSSTLLVSAVSAWEISTKQRLGKLPKADALVGAYRHHVDRLGGVRLPVTEDHALLAGRLEWQHNDPFDRILAAQAMIESLTLISKDRQFRKLAGVPVLW